MVTMQQDGILKVLAGKTTFDEVTSATGEIVVAWFRLLSVNGSRS